MLLGERISLERKSLGLTQAEAAELCGVTRGMWGRYENNKASMGSDILARFVQAGADAIFILTGERGAPSRMTSQEAALLDNYRHCPESAQRNLEQTSALLAQRGCKKLKDAG